MSSAVLPPPSMGTQIITRGRPSFIQNRLIPARCTSDHREAQAAPSGETSAAASTAPTRCSRFSSLFVRTFGHDNSPYLPRSHASDPLTSRGRLGSRWRPQCPSRHPGRRPDRSNGTDADQCVIPSSSVPRQSSTCCRAEWVRCTKVHGTKERTDNPDEGHQI
ncbi:hypothetical protein L226DRAFT_78226 [Lentinus tigrinus ALCF2SS1-7]|uniref:uncharacterized protein n=1 Tax=Lentinus tigrinus ALCF2SS1-7 TaxID=1328758 RepID=UPI0011661123|nr:hypothetical protein L226DRAFT_78226 [Lentinus tigrinus ALCF2SS1-7]